TDAGGAAEAHDVVVDWGDGTSDKLQLAAGTTTFGVQHVYNHNLPHADPATLPIHVTVSDPSGASGTASTSIAVKNVPPAFEAGGDAFGTVGVPFTQTISFTDPTTDPVTVTLDFGDGDVVTFKTTQRQIVMDHLYNDEISANVLVQIDDGRGGVVSDSFRVDV